MNFPKYKETVYIVERKLLGDSLRYPVGVFRSLEGAEAFKYKCEQDFLDRKFVKDVDFSFHVTISTYYD